MSLTKQALEYYSAKFNEYVKSRRSSTLYFQFDHTTTDVEQELMCELRDEGLVESLNLYETMWQFTHEGRLGPSQYELDDVAPLQLGDTINIHNSPIGAFATRGATATGSVTLSGTISQADYRASIADVHKALIDRADDLDQRIYDFATEILIKLRRIELQPGPVPAVLAQVQAKLDESWATEEAKKMKPSFAKLGIELAELVKHPLAEEVLTLILKQGRA